MVFFELENLAADIDGDLAERSPFATAVVTSAMFRTWAVRFDAIELTESVRSFQTPRNAFDIRLAAELSFRSDLARHARHLTGERIELIHHDVDRVLQLQNLATDLHRDLAGEIALGDGRGHFRDVADLRGEVRCHRVHRIGEILPDTDNALHVGLAAELAFRSDFAGHARDLTGERIELVDHGVDRVLQLENLAARRHRDLGREIASGDGGRNLRDVAHLGGQVAGHAS